MSKSLLSVKDVKKYRGEVKAVDGVSFEVPQGACIGLLGPNGAGKSTTMEMLESLVVPTSGEILFRNRRLDDDYRQKIGIQFQYTALQDHLTVGENLQLFASLYRHALPLPQLAERCQIADLLDRDPRRLSGGQRQKLLLAIALVNEPEVVFLDEPTTGLDPQARRNFWDLVRDLRNRGSTVILSTHYMDEAEALCDQLIIMERGRVIASGSPAALLTRHGAQFVFDLPREAMKDRGDAFDPVDCNERVEIFSSDVEVSLRELMAAGIPLSDLRIRQRTLDDLFVQLTGVRH